MKPKEIIVCVGLVGAIGGILLLHENVLAKNAGVATSGLQDLQQLKLLKIEL